MAYNLYLYRSWFPHLAAGKIWLNHAAVSPLSSRVTRIINNYVSNRSVDNIDVFPSILKSVQHTKSNLASLIGATPDRIAFVTNTSEGLNILAGGLGWKSGDRILLNDSEFPANVVPFLNLKRLGIEIDFVKNKNGEILVEDIEAMMTPRTKLLSISFVQFLSGFKADLVAIGELCKRRGVIFCVDSIQGLGVAPLDVQKAQIDFLSNGGHKWLMGLMGLGFIFITNELQERIQQRYAGWTSNKEYFSDLFRYRIDFDDTARRYEIGGENFLAVAALEESTSLLIEVGIENIEQHLHSVNERIFSFADENGIEVLTPRGRSQRAGIVTLKHSRAKEIFQELNENRIVIALREGMLRIAPHFYNADEDMDVLFSILRMSIT